LHAVRDVVEEQVSNLPRQPSLPMQRSTEFSPLS
jgi:hypothetical protein